MKYLLLIYVDPELLGGMPADEFNETMRDCIAQADQMKQDGSLLDAQMLQGATTARSIRVRNGRRTITDGPFTETKELLAGFNLIEAESMEEAERIAAEFPWAATGCVEIRPVLDRDAMRAAVSRGDALVMRPGM